MTEFVELTFVGQVIMLLSIDPQFIVIYHEQDIDNTGEEYVPTLPDLMLCRLSKAYIKSVRNSIQILSLKFLRSFEV